MVFSNNTMWKAELQFVDLEVGVTRIVRDKSNGTEDNQSASGAMYSVYNKDTVNDAALSRLRMRLTYSKLNCTNAIYCNIV